MQGKCDALLVDLECIPAALRFETLAELAEAELPMVVLADESRTTARELVQRGISHYCRRPLCASEVAMTLRRACEESELRREMDDVEVPMAGRAQAPANPPQMIGSGPRSREVHEMIERIAGLDAFVLITGECGTGKELIARAIHARSRRSKNRFVAVSCGAIPESLIEAELFGSEKGAFTGAQARRTGYFEEADGGTILLDEVGELSLYTQVKLLRVLQEREFMRLGSNTGIPMRARVLFATNRNLKEMVELGTFRKDLFYRMNVIGIHSPALRERTEDIPLLAQHFLSKHAQSCQKTIRGIEADAMELLLAYSWPGNVRELENAMQRALILSHDGMIRSTDLPEDVVGLPEAAHDSVPQAVSFPGSFPGSFEDALRDYKGKLVVEAVKECHGNKTLAAQTLNISRTYLHRLIRESGIDGASLKVA
jgi:DNA-binding NtrC family response regulator